MVNHRLWRIIPPITLGYQSLSPEVVPPSDVCEKTSMVGSSIVYYKQKLVGGFTLFLFSRIYGIILPIPIDFHIFQDGYCTTKQRVIGAMFTNVAIPN